jgi:Fic-DOC domain mobile mystery protein B
MALLPALLGETPIDPSGLKPKLRARGVSTRGEINKLEALNVRMAIAKYLSARPTKRTAPFTLTWVKKVHQSMFGDVWSWAGVFRTQDLSIGIPWQQVEVSLFNLLKDLSAWKQHGFDLIEQAAWLHHRAVQIHPFPNGNGRWSRLLANIWLKLHGRAPTDWPAETLLASSTSRIRDQYITAINEADKGDYRPLLELHRKYTPMA